MGWQVKKLGDVCQFQNGFAFKSSLFSDTGVPILRISNIQDGVIDLKRIVYTDPASYSENLDKYLVRDGELLIAMSGATTGKIGINQTGLVFFLNQRVGKFIPSEKLNQQYLYYYLFTKVEEHLEKSAGSAQPNLSTEQIKGLELPVPPIQEQKRIVAILDEVFADIEQARAKTEQNLKNARELFESYLQQVFSQRDIKSVEFGDIMETLTDYHANGSYKVLKENVELKEEEDFAWMVRSTDFEKKFKNNKRYITEHAYNYLTKSKLFGGEIIMSKIGNAGKVYFMPHTSKPCSLAMNLFLIRLDPKKADNEYVYRYLNSTSGKAQIAPRLNGAATLTITKENVRTLLIPLPTLSVQQESIQALSVLERKVETLENIYQEKIIKIELLKQSVLQKAFSGELTLGASKEEVA